MRALPERNKPSAAVSGTRLLCVLFIGATLNGCNSLPERRVMPAYLDVTQSEPRAAYQPHEYVFCDPNGGAWSCAVVSRKTPVTLISHPSGISHEKDNDAGAPSGVGQGLPAVSRPNVIQSKPGRPGGGQEVFDEADELGKPMPEHEGPVPEAQRAARAR